MDVRHLCLIAAIYNGAIWYIPISFIAMDIPGMFDAWAKPRRSWLRQGS